MRLCLDEHYSVQIAADLRERGHDVQCVKERADLVGASDPELLKAMIGERRALVTEDVADFAPLIKALAANGESHSGLIFTSPATMPRSRNTVGLYVEALHALLRRHPSEGDFANGVHWLTPSPTA